ncbi:unnamed protein product [Caenorhabditis bovis]|uniref:Uncharacterized protein n=1 Tax=Caenorhabditis bovis TaxID=2654633 RepID=A0A8S1F5V9_9PELO|nr:unnamed protein product [Caenorhabditis bovis]
MSGGQLNPAVSLLLWSMGHLKLAWVLAYSLAQTAVAFVAAALIYAYYYERFDAFDGGNRTVLGATSTADQKSIYYRHPTLPTEACYPIADVANTAMRKKCQGIGRFLAGIERMNQMEHNDMVCMALLRKVAFLFAIVSSVWMDFNSYVIPQPYPKRTATQSQIDISSESYLKNDGAAFNQGGIDSYGETRDFLQFLRRIQYDHRQVPENDKGEATFVEVSVVISNIRAVSEVTMDYALEMFYRESWRDPRLQYDRHLFKNKTELALHESYTSFLWFPDTFVPNAIASKNPQRNSISHRSLLRLDETGKLLYSRRISLVCECTMDLTLFPFDKQLCKLGFESYGYTADHVVYKWSQGARTALELKKIRLPDFTIQEAYVTSQMETYATGNYSRLYVCFVFSRSSGFCFLQLIIPSTAVVITSWVSLWMETETEFQDMISIILAITFLIFSYNEMMPRVSYIKAMDIYLGVCFMIVFLSLIKLAFVKYMRQKLLLTSNSGHSMREMHPLKQSTKHRLKARKSSKLLFQNCEGSTKDDL